MLIPRVGFGNRCCRCFIAASNAASNEWHSGDVEQTLALIGYVEGEQSRRTGRRFANGELMALIGEAERAGAKTVAAILQHIVSAKGWDPTDAKLAARLTWSVKDCRKRMNARGD